jgi:ribonuclease HI
MIEAWCDGSSRGNPGVGGYSVVIKKDNKILHKDSVVLGIDVTCNTAEYCGMMYAIEQLFYLNPEKEPCTIRTDSALVVGQLTKGWKINKEHLKVLNNSCRYLLDRVGFDVDIVHVPRGQNGEANRLAQKITERKG